MTTEMLFEKFCDLTARRNASRTKEQSQADYRECLESLALALDLLVDADSGSHAFALCLSNYNPHAAHAACEEGWLTYE